VPHVGRDTTSKGCGASPRWGRRPDTGTHTRLDRARAAGRWRRAWTWTGAERGGQLCAPARGLVPPPALGAAGGGVIGRGDRSYSSSRTWPHTHKQIQQFDSIPELNMHRREGFAKSIRPQANKNQFLEKGRKKNRTPRTSKIRLRRFDILNGNMIHAANKYSTRISNSRNSGHCHVAGRFDTYVPTSEHRRRRELIRFGTASLRNPSDQTSLQHRARAHVSVVPVFCPLLKTELERARGIARGESLSRGIRPPILFVRGCGNVERGS
jgi:hypothetical protein